MGFCTACGRQLAGGVAFCPGCGSRTGPPAATAVAASATPPPPTAPPPVAEPDPGSVVESPGDAVERPKRRGRRLLIGVGIVAVVALVAAGGAFFWVKENRGASSPEEAVRRFATAIGDNDPIGMFLTLHPDEIGPMKDLYQSVQTTAERSGVASADVGKGTKVELTGVELSSDELGPGLAKVEVTGGEISVQLGGDAATLVTTGSGGLFGSSAYSKFDSVGSAIGDGPCPFASCPAMRPRTTSTGGPEPVGEQQGSWTTKDVEPKHRFLVAREVDGRWYVSPAFSLAEHIRIETEGARAPEYDAARPQPGERRGADSPEKAVEGMIRAIAELDPDKGVQFLSPRQSAVAYDYLDVWFDRSVRDDLKEAKADARPEIETIDVKKASEKGGRALVEVRSVSWSQSDDGDRTDFAIDGRCLTSTESNGDEETSCLDEYSEIGNALPEYGTVVTRREGGRWYVDPVASVVELARGVLTKVDPAVVRWFLGIEPTAGTIAADGSPRTVELPNRFSTASYVVDTAAPNVYLISVACDGAIDSAELGTQDESVQMDELDAPSDSTRYLVTTTQPTSLVLSVRGVGSDRDADTRPASSCTVTAAPLPAPEPMSVPGDGSSGISNTGSVSIDAGVDVRSFTGRAGQQLWVEAMPIGSRPEYDYQSATSRSSSSSASASGGYYYPDLSAYFDEVLVAPDGKLLVGSFGGLPQDGVYRVVIARSGTSPDYAVFAQVPASRSNPYSMPGE